MVHRTVVSPFLFLSEGSQGLQSGGHNTFLRNSLSRKLVEDHRNESGCRLVPMATFLTPARRRGHGLVSTTGELMVTCEHSVEQVLQYQKFAGHNTAEIQLQEVLMQAVLRGTVQLGCVSPEHNYYRHQNSQVLLVSCRLVAIPEYSRRTPCSHSREHYSAVSDQ